MSLNIRSKFKVVVLNLSCVRVRLCVDGNALEANPRIALLYELYF